MDYLTNIGTKKSRDAMLEALDMSSRVDGYVPSSELFANYCSVRSKEYLKNEFASRLRAVLTVERDTYRTRRFNGKQLRSINIDAIISWAMEVPLEKKAMGLSVICPSCKCKIPREMLTA